MGTYFKKESSEQRKPPAATALEGATVAGGGKLHGARVGQGEQPTAELLPWRMGSSIFPTPPAAQCSTFPQHTLRSQIHP
jgi:hypothetical protein